MRQISKIAVSGLAIAMAFGLHTSFAQETAQPSAKPPAHPYTKQHLYDETADPMALIADGLKQARAEHKRVILDFGGDWCGDCQVLDIYLHDPANWTIAQKNFVIVHIFIGHMDKNIELAASYGVPINKGVPALAVLNSNGVLLYSQKTGQFNDMRHMDVASLTEFLNKWKA
jgi:thiol:disulfide interchange protein